MFKNIKYPIEEILPEVLNHLKTHNTLVLNAPTGSGKSTWLPLFFLEESWLGNKKIILLEPRRIAAKLVAERLAFLLNEEVGNSIGYRIRFDTKVSKKTRLEVVTEGILSNMLLSDNALEEVGMIIFDEFHERSIHADLALALAKNCQDVLRPDLRLLIMSATLNTLEISEKLNTSYISGKGKSYPVEIKYTSETDRTILPQSTIQCIKTAIHQHEGDVLVFLPGEFEIQQTYELLKKENLPLITYPLFSKLPYRDQQKALLPHSSGKRKIVLATSIAETSLTIEGIKIVIDSGYSRISKFDYNTGLSKLETIRVSKDSADQRAGRAGRISSGVCYRMWSIATQQQLKEYRTPEIEEADITPLLLNVYAWGCKNIQDLYWTSLPSTKALITARETLENIGAIKDNSLTDHGKKLQRIPAHPRIAHMLLFAKDQHILPLATDIAAIIEEKDFMPKETGVDINLRIEALRRYRSQNKIPQFVQKIEKTASFYRTYFNINAENTEVNPYETGLLIASAYPEKIASSIKGNHRVFQMANGSWVQLTQSDELSAETWLAVAHAHLSEKNGKIFLASPIQPSDLKPFVTEKEHIQWNTKKGGLFVEKQLRLGSILLGTAPLLKANEEIIKQVIYQALKAEGEHLLNWSNEVTQWQNRILSLSIWNRDQDWPNVLKDTLLKNTQDWLPIENYNIKCPSDIYTINILPYLHNLLNHEQKDIMQSLAPEKVLVPSGSYIPIEYFADGKNPVLAVRLQELFGLQNPPLINHGKNPLVIHLLSPGYKVVQITSDLESFWNVGYQAVKKELQRKYPKHFWPENPKDAKAIKGVKK